MHMTLEKISWLLLGQGELILLLEREEKREKRETSKTQPEINHHLKTSYPLPAWQPK